MYRRYIAGGKLHNMQLSACASCRLSECNTLFKNYLHVYQRRRRRFQGGVLFFLSSSSSSRFVL